MNDMTNIYYEYLVILRDSGKINMFGAGQYLETEFDLTKKEAKEILMAWMKSFNDTEGK